MTDRQVTEQASLHRALAFGDSVMWGQGLVHDDKFATRIAREVYSVDLPQNAMIAHSGAIIDTHEGDETTDVAEAETAPVYGEIPRSHPSIFRQVLTYGLPLPHNEVPGSELPDVVFRGVEVVFVNGGINDIDASVIISEDVGTLAQFEHRVRDICETRFLHLLRTIRRRFPAAQIVVPGYHFVFSQDSLRALVEALDVFFEEGGAVADQLRRAIRQSNWFMGLATAAQYRAVDAFNAQDLHASGPGAYVVPSLHGPEHAAFASQSMSWQFKGIGEALRRGIVAVIQQDPAELAKLTSLDPVQEIRGLYCIAYAVDVRGGLGRELMTEVSCQLAGLFHPDDRFADRMTTRASRIRSRVSARGSMRGQMGDGSASLGDLASRSALSGPVSWRQLFTTDIVGTIRLDGVIEPGSTGDFPYHLLSIQFEVGADRTAFTYRLNDLLPFIRGFADRDDDLFPGAYGEVVQSGGLMTVRNIVEDTPFTFFAHPTDEFSLLDVGAIRVLAGAVPAAGPFVLRVRDPRIEINGRALDLATDTIAVRTGSSVSLLP